MKGIWSHAGAALPKVIPELSRLLLPGASNAKCVTGECKRICMLLSIHCVRWFKTRLSQYGTTASVPLYLLFLLPSLPLRLPALLAAPSFTASPSSRILRPPYSLSFHFLTINAPTPLSPLLQLFSICFLQDLAVLVFLYFRFPSVTFLSFFPPLDHCSFLDVIFPNSCISSLS